MLDNGLDVLRNKELSFGCIVECEGVTDTIISKHINRTNIKGDDEFCYKLLSSSGENISSDYDNFKGYIIVGHPLNYGRFIYMVTKYGGNLDIPYKIQLVFRYDAKLYDQTELERMQHEKWEDLKKLLIEFCKFFTVEGQN